MLYPITTGAATRAGVGSTVLPFTISWRTPASWPCAWQEIFVVDGGRGQLQVALSAARDLGLHGCCAR